MVQMVVSFRASVSNEQTADRFKCSVSDFVLWIGHVAALKEANIFKTWSIQQVEGGGGGFFLPQEDQGEGFNESVPD